MAEVNNGAAVRVQQQGRICTVTLDNPGKLNAMARSMWRDLRRVFLAIQQDPDLRCVVLCGSDANFCAGGDIAE